ncbi:MAG: hypothetical protein ABIM97_12785 [Ginsengibacter sp.]
MSNRNPGNHWKNKLDDVGSLSNEIVIDKNAAWKKLSTRLSRKHRRIKPVWYWAAAACLLFAVIMPLYIINKKPNDLVKNNLPEIKSPEVTVLKTSPSKENTGVIIYPSLIDKKKTRPHALPGSNRTNVTAIQKKEEILPANINDQKNLQYETTLLPAVINTAEIIAAAMPEKKKLKVVHINELGEPVEETPNIARHYERHPFKLNFINQQVYSGSSLPGNKTGFTFFKITSPN